MNFRVAEKHINTQLWSFSKSKFNPKPDHVNLVAQASPIDCLFYLPNVRTIQYKLGPERWTRLGNSNVLRLSVIKEQFTFRTFVSEVSFF